jgi:hypothetical protein
MPQKLNVSDWGEAKQTTSKGNTFSSLLLLFPKDI